MATTIGPDEELTSVEREGLVWLTLLSSGKATTEDLAALERWQQQDAAHAAAFARAVRLHRMLGTPGLAETPHYRAPVWQRPLARRAVLGGGMMAAAGYLVIRPPMELWPSLAELSADYRTGTGQRQQVALAQGVTLDLNTQTSIGRRPDAGRCGITLISDDVAAVANLPQA